MVARSHRPQAPPWAAPRRSLDGAGGGGVEEGVEVGEGSLNSLFRTSAGEACFVRPVETKPCLFVEMLCSLSNDTYVCLRHIP